MEPHEIRSPLRKVIVAAMLAVAILILSVSFNQTGNAANKDFVSYWAAGRQLIHHLDPYNRNQIFFLERTVGFRPPQPLFMRNPPYALFLALPLGFLGLNAAAVLWSLLLVAAILISIRILWQLHGSPSGSLHLVGYLFAPVTACMTLGQTSAFALLGLALFLRLHNRSAALAGAALCLLTIKPHLFLPFGVVVLLWVGAQKNFRVLLGFTAAIIALSVLPLAFDPSVWTEYVPVFAEADRESQFIPTLSAVTRHFAGHGAVWTQFLLAAAGCLWSTRYFWRNRHDWDWTRHGSLVLLVSMLVAPYSWFADEAIVLPAILAAVLSTGVSTKSLVIFAILDSIALLATLAGIPFGSGFYIWTPLAWLSWYVYSTWERIGRFTRENHNLRAPSP